MSVSRFLSIYQSFKLDYLDGACSARSFMRFKSGKVKFVAVDEPSAAALDAEGLIAARDLVYRQVLSRVGFY